MRIAATADLHFMPAQGRPHCRSNSNGCATQADVLVLAGDLTNYGKPERNGAATERFGTLRVPIIAVLGNHDYESG